MGAAGPDPGDGTISWQQLADEAAARLAGGGVDEVDDAARHARLIVMTACGAEADEWLTVGRQPATKRGVATIDTMTARRLRGEPLQYVLGSWGFRYLDLYLDDRVLIPRPETEVVAGLALGELERLAPDGLALDGVAPADEAVIAVDLGTGSGAIGLSLASEHEGAEVWLTDVSADSLVVAQANLAGLGRAGSRVRVAEGSWFDALPADLEGRVGVIASNPPYVAEHEQLPDVVADWEPTGALVSGPTGTEHIEHIVDESPRWLRSGGALVVEMAPDQTGPMAERASTHFAEVHVEPDLTGKPRALLARHPRPAEV